VLNCTYIFALDCTYIFVLDCTYIFVLDCTYIFVLDCTYIFSFHKDLINMLGRYIECGLYFFIIQETVSLF